MIHTLNVRSSLTGNAKMYINTRVPTRTLSARLRPKQIRFICSNLQEYPAAASDPSARRERPQKVLSAHYYLDAPLRLWFSLICIWAGTKAAHRKSYALTHSHIYYIRTLWAPSTSTPRSLLQYDPKHVAKRFTFWALYGWMGNACFFLVYDWRRFAFGIDLGLCLFSCITTGQFVANRGTLLVVGGSNGGIMWCG